MQNDITYLPDMKNDIAYIREYFSTDKLFSRNTFTHIILPAIIGAFLSFFITFDGANGYIQGGRSVQRHVATAVFASVISVAVTSYVAGIPDNTEKRMKTWVTAMALSIGFPGTLSYINNIQNQITGEKQNNSELVTQIINLQQDVNKLKQAGIPNLSSTDKQSINQNIIKATKSVVENAQDSSRKEQALENLTTSYELEPSLLKNKFVQQESQEIDSILYKSAEIQPETRERFNQRIKAIGESANIPKTTIENQILFNPAPSATR